MNVAHAYDEVAAAYNTHAASRFRILKAIEAGRI